MKTLLIAALAAAGLLTCACTAQGNAAPPPAAASQRAAIHHRHHHHHHEAASAAQQSAPSGGYAAAPAGAAAGGAPNTTAIAAPCSTRYLAAQAGISQGVPGGSYLAIVFKNLNNAPCTLYGYPGVSLAGGKPVTQIGQAADENPATPRELVTLAPGGVANALLKITDAAGYPASVCGPVTAHWLQIYPPNQTAPVYLYYTSPACTQPVHLLTVDAVRPGSVG
jgi:hypothetical protein